MRNLIDFILKYSSAFIFTFLFVICVALLFSNGKFHSSIWFTSANTVSHKVYQLGNGVTGYFNLREINNSLQRSNAKLENEVLNLRTKLAVYESLLGDSVKYSVPQRFDYVSGTVLNNSTRHPRNYFTIDKGENDGVESGMGVVDQNGIVGIVNVAGPHTSRIISVLNVNQHISVRLKNSNVVGLLTWKTDNPEIAYMEEVPKHTKLQKGDTVVTSGYSTSFPADLPVGVVLGRADDGKGSFHVLKVKLASDFNTLSTVRVIKDFYKAELDSLKAFDISSE